MQFRLRWLTGLVAIALFTGARVHAQQPPAADEAIVPDLSVFRTVSEMKAVCAHAGLGLSASAAKQVTPSKDLEFRVAWQSPQPNAIEKKGRAIVVEIYQEYRGGPPPVPSVTGLSKSHAEKFITDAGLVPVGEPGVEATHPFFNNTVYVQHPSGDTPLPADRRVIFTYYLPIPTPGPSGSGPTPPPPPTGGPSLLGLGTGGTAGPQGPSHPAAPLFGWWDPVIPSADARTFRIGPHNGRLEVDGLYANGAGGLDLVRGVYTGPGITGSIREEYGALILDYHMSGQATGGADVNFTRRYALDGADLVVTDSERGTVERYRRSAKPAKDLN